MIDYVKINNLSIGLLIKDRLDFEVKVVEQTGEALTDKKKSAYYKNMIFTLTPGDRFAKVQGSLHKLSNGGQYNNDRFTFAKFRQVYEDLSRIIKPDDNINVIELGVNIITPFNPTDFIDCLICHGKTQFNKVKTQRMEYAQCSHTHYAIKIYNKGLQQPTGSYILRVEVRQERMQKLFPEGLKWSQLVDPRIWEYLGEVLKEKFSEVIYYDPSIQLDLVPEKERQIIDKGYNPIYWQNNKSDHAYREKKQFQDLVKKHGTMFNSLPDLISEEVSDLVKSYHYSDEQNRNPELSKMVESYNYSFPEDLNSKNTDLGDLVKSYTLLSCINSPTHENNPLNRLCKVTGIDISMQKPESKFLNVSGIKFLFENNSPAFEELRRKQLTRKWENETLKVQYREIAHSIRNKYHNPLNGPRHNARRAINTLYSDPLLFDIVPFILPEKMMLAGLN